MAALPATKPASCTAQSRRGPRPPAAPLPWDALMPPAPMPLPGAGLAGRVLDARGEPVDGRGPLPRRPVLHEAAAPWARRLIRRPLVTGILAVDGLLTLGEGQGLGVFGPAGSGKRALLGMLARGPAAAVNVIALADRPGPAVRRFIDEHLGAQGLARSVLVVSGPDPHAGPVQAALLAAGIAGQLRDLGARVLLLVDALTARAPAQCLPSAFTVAAQVLQRAGPGRSGSLTAVCAVQTGSPAGDRLAEDVRGIVDGHIVLSRALALEGHHPGIDVAASASRLMGSLVGPEHRAAAARLRLLLTGAGPGGNALREPIRQFLSQPPQAQQPMAHTVAALQRLAACAPTH